MFTLLVSWLLVACVPGLLMLSALGLGRLEKDLAHDAVTATGIGEFLEYADAVDMHTLARKGLPEALEYLYWRRARQLPGSPLAGSTAGPRHAAPSFAADFYDRGEVALPTRIHAQSRINPQFKGTRQVNRV